MGVCMYVSLFSVGGYAPYKCLCCWWLLWLMCIDLLFKKCYVLVLRWRMCKHDCCSLGGGVGVICDGVQIKVKLCLCFKFRCYYFSLKISTEFGLFNS